LDARESKFLVLELGEKTTANVAIGV